MKDIIKINDIADGIRFISCKTDRFKNTRLSVRFAMPLDENTASANALIAGLLRHTSAAFSENIAMERHLASLYGADFSSYIDKLGDAQIISFVLTSVADKFALAGEAISLESVEFLKEIIFNPDLDKNGLFKEVNIEREKRLLCENIEAELNNKITYALMKMEENMFACESYSVNVKGIPDRIACLSASDITDAWKRLLSSARVQITAVGSCDMNAVSDIFKSAFESINREPGKIVTNIHKQSGEIKICDETLPIQQGKLVMGWTIGTQNEYALKVFEAVFGAGVNSKLFKVVREKMSLCYYCSARIIRIKGVMYVQSGIENANRDKAVNAVKEQLDNVKQNNFTDEDLRLAKISLDDAYKSAFDTTAEIDSWYASQMLDENLRDIESFRTEIQKVTRNQVVECAQSAVLDTVFTLN